MTNSTSRLQQHKTLFQRHFIRSMFRLGIKCQPAPTMTFTHVSPCLFTDISPTFFINCLDRIVCVQEELSCFCFFFHVSRINWQNKKAKWWKLIHLQCVLLHCTVWKNFANCLNENVTITKAQPVERQHWSHSNRTVASCLFPPGSASVLNHGTVTGLKLKCYKYFSLFFAFDGKLQSGKWYEWHCWWAELNEIRDFWKLEFILAVFFLPLMMLLRSTKYEYIEFYSLHDLLSQTTQ